MFRNRSFVILMSGVAFLVALGMLDFSSRQAVSAEQATSTPASAAEPLPEMSLGNPNAPVKIIEYASLSCPHCAAFNKDVFPALKADYIDTGKVYYTLREFPHNEQGLAGAVLARCLDPSRYFAFTDLLFSKQSEWAFQDDPLPPLRQLAKQAGLSDADFDKCIDNEELQKRILATRAGGEKLGVNAIPTLFVNGNMLKGPATLEALAEAMKPYLNTQ